MSSTSGLSSNTSNNQPRNSLQLDASTRDSILAQNQARIMSALGVSKKDQFTSGGVGGLNPLKGLYSAAAATFLKNKQSQQSEESSRGLGSYEKAADILKSLAAKKSESSDPGASFQSTNTKVSGPASSTNYKKYQWDGNPGVKGSDVVYDDDGNSGGVKEAAPAEESATPADLSAVYKAFSNVVTDGGGTIGDRGDGTSEFKVLDIVGTLTQKGDKYYGQVTGDSGTYTFEIAADGAVKIDASKGNTASEEFDQLKHLLSGNLDGARRKSAASEPEPSGEPAVSDPKPSGEAAVPQAAEAIPSPAEAVVADLTALTAAEQAALDKAAADKTAAELAAKSSDIGTILTSSTMSLASLLGSGKSTDLGRYNVKLLVSDLQAAGGAVATKDASTLNITLNGQAGTITLNDDKVKGTLGTGKGQISFEIQANGDVKISGSDSNLTAQANSLALRKAMGTSTKVGTDFQARVVKYNRYGTGTGLNLLG